MSESPPEDDTPLVAARGIVKTFGAFTALGGVDLTVKRGEIHALLGENGAGKSTLIKILGGLLAPDAGTITWDGRPVAIDDPATARALGIGIVFQHFALFEALTVAENIALALGPSVTPRNAARLVEALGSEHGLPVPADREVGTLSVGERQRVEILRCLAQKPRLLILDEPTSVLTPQEAADLFATLRRLAAGGCSVLFISHKLDEVRALTSAATILRAGKVVAHADPRRETAASLAAAMVGTEIPELKPAAAHALGPPRLVVDQLASHESDPHAVALKDISLEVRGGEIVGIAGIAGNGQKELFAHLAGERLAERAAMIRIDDRDAGMLGPTERRQLGAAFVPEERLGHAAVPNFSLTDNAFVTRHATSGAARGGLLRRSAARRIADAVISRFHVRTRGPGTEARRLSGGNLQKYVIGRDMIADPKVLVVDQPTWGVDAAAAAAIRQALIDLAAEGAAVLVISQDLDELFQVADRIAVLSLGRLGPARPVAALSRTDVGLAMGGIAAAEAERAHEAAAGAGEGTHAPHS